MSEEELAEWKVAAQRAGKKLNTWQRRVLNEAAQLEEILAREQTLDPR
jgi:predicted HicB family RNase H-like nuclease